MKSILITFEGIDFCGKSVQLELLANRIVNLSKSVIVIREPGGTLISEKIRNILLKNEHESMNPVTEFLLYSAARAQLVQEKILPNLNAGKIILCDRYYDSSTAYQGYGRGIALDNVQQINKLATQNISPDISFLLDIDIDELERRKKKNNTQLDRIEEETKTFFDTVRKGYLEIAENERDRFKIIDGTKTIPEIENEIWNYLDNYFQGGIYVF